MERPVTKSLLFLVLVGGGRHATGRGRNRRDDAGCLSDKILKGSAFLLNNLSTPQLPGSSDITGQRRMGKGFSLHVSWTAELIDLEILSPQLPGGSAITVQRRMGKGISVHVSWTAELIDLEILSPKNRKSSLKSSMTESGRRKRCCKHRRLDQVGVVHIKTNYHPKEAYKSLLYVFFHGQNLWHICEQQTYKIEIFEVVKKIQ